MRKSANNPELTPLLTRLVALVGRRADDPELIAFVTRTLGKKVPESITDLSGAKNVSDKKYGLELAFTHDIKNDLYPLIPKTKNSFVTYLERAWIKPKFPEPPPFGLRHEMSSEEITDQLGVAPGTLGVTTMPYWERDLDSARNIVLGIERGSASTVMAIAVKQASELASRYHPPLQQRGLFVAWAIQRNLLDETRFPAHSALLAAIRKRQKKGSELLAAALPRGLWDIHLKDLPNLRKFAYAWFHNFGGSYIVFDLIKVFKARPGPYGHDEPVLDDDDWNAVEKATKTLDQRFAEWVGNGQA